MTNIPIKLGLGKPNFRLMSTLFFFLIHASFYLSDCIKSKDQDM